uniref:Conserved secreted protein n=1 Tax=Strongyloides venezuelensis TaxID=75913 RepID=A0A0K0EVI5_STRVS
MKINILIFLFFGLIVVFATAREVRRNYEENPRGPQGEINPMPQDRPHGSQEQVKLTQQGGQPGRPQQEGPVRPPHQRPVRPPHQGPVRPQHQGPVRPPHQKPVRPPHQKPVRPPHQGQIRPQIISPLINWQNQPWTGRHWNQNPWNGFYFPQQPNDLTLSWNLPNDFIPNNKFNPFGRQFDGTRIRRYNYADRYAYEFFRRNGYSAQSALVFCSNIYIKHIIDASRSVSEFCTSINQSYGRNAIPTFPKNS